VLAKQHYDVRVSTLRSSLDDRRRPRILLEICEAVRLQKPVVLLELKGEDKDFNFEQAFTLLGDLETNLLLLSPSAIVELRALTKQPLSELQETLQQVLEMGLDRGVPQLNIAG
jgi:hypothetical protein